MNGTKEQVLEFIAKCGEFKKCKFIMATTKIKDLLKQIVNCPELYKLFDDVTTGFNYPEAKSKCLVSSDNGIFRRGCLVLPRAYDERLAFIFCLLVDFDREAINFNDFLKSYFSEDGSYYVSYQAFCSTVIDSLADTVAEIFRELLDSGEREEPSRANAEASYYIGEIVLTVESEKQFLNGCGIAETERTAGAGILDRLAAAVKTDNVELIDALILAYNYFVLYNRCVSDNVNNLIECVAALEQVI